MDATERQPTVLFLFEDELSPFYASFSLARALVNDGFKVIYACSERISPYLKESGFAHCVFSGQDSNALEEEFSAFIDRHPVDVALLDPTLPGLALILLKFNLPLIGLTNNLASVVHWNATPVFSNLVPKPDAPFANRVLNVLAWANLYLKFHIPLHLLTGVHLLTRFSLPDYTKIGRQLKKYNVAMRWGEYGYRMKIPELVLSPADLDFPSVARWNDRYCIGALIDVNQADEPFDWSPIDPGRPVIYCSLGSHGPHYPETKPFLSLVVKLISQHPQLQLILQIRSDEILEYLRPAKTDNIHLYKWVPQKEILSRTALFITHGGFGSVKEALYYQVPMVVCPFHADHFGNAARVHYKNFGKRVVRFLSKKKLEEALLQVLSDQSIKQSIRVMSGKIRQESSQEAVTLIRQLAGIGAASFAPDR